MDRDASYNCRSLLRGRIALRNERVRQKLVWGAFVYWRGAGATGGTAGATQLLLLSSNMDAHAVC
jgi:hypothetical protein